MRRLSILFIFISSIISAQDIAKLLPDSAGIWVKSDKAEIYSGNELFRLIDGGAEIFKEYGFKQAIVQNYKDKEDEAIDVEIYEMNDSSSSFGIFSLFTRNTGEKVKFNSEAFMGDEFLLFRKGNYYVSLTALNLSNKTKEGLFLIAEKITPHILAFGKPPFAVLFDNYVNSKIVYIKGKLSFYNLSTMDLGSDFKIYEGIYIGNNSGDYFIFKYMNRNECQINYDYLQKYLKINHQYKFLKPGPNKNLFANEKKFVMCSSLRNYIIISFSENKVDMEKTDNELGNILE